MKKIAPGSYALSITLIGVLFFLFGFITWLNSVLIPFLKLSCQLSNFQAFTVAFAFYISYFFMAIPSAWVLRMTGFKGGIALGLVTMALGALVFIPAANTRIFGLFLTGLFIQGTGLAILQTASNPYVTILGPLESAARRISIMGICNKVAGAISPLILAAIVLGNSNELITRITTLGPQAPAELLDQLAQRVIFPYLVMAISLAGLALFVWFSPLPQIDTDNMEPEADAHHGHKTSVLQFPHLVWGVIALFFYVGVEVIAADTIITYGMSLHLSPFFIWGINLAHPTYFATYTLLAMVLGYSIGIFTIPRFIRQDQALAISALLGILFSILAIFTNGIISVVFIALLGLANALVWPAIWPLALEGLGRFTKIASSLLIMAIAGGATLPLVYGAMADVLSNQIAYWILVPGYLIILFYAVRGHKLRS